MARLENVAAMVNYLKNGDALVPELTRVTAKVATTAKRLCPVDTGRLRASIQFDVGHDARGPVGRVWSDVEYAPYVEFGTRFMDAEPFLRPALASVVGGSAAAA